MVVTITSEIFGKQPGETYDGPQEDWLLAQGYARQDDYEGPGVSNTGATDVDPGDDPTLASNREAPYFPSTPDRNATIANDENNLTELKFPAPVNFDVDDDGVDTEAVSVSSLEPAAGSVGGGTVVRIYADNVAGTTGVTFDAVAGTDLEVNVEAGYLDVTTPAHAAGAVDVVVTDDVGSDTVTDGFTYEA